MSIWYNQFEFKMHNIYMTAKNFSLVLFLTKIYAVSLKSLKQTKQVFISKHVDLFSHFVQGLGIK